MRSTGGRKTNLSSSRRLIGTSAIVLISICGTVGGVAAGEEAPDACGCYQDAMGSCLCSRKATCGCPGECEPKGCEEKREKVLQKEIAAETLKVEDAARKHKSADAREPSPSEATDRPRDLRGHRPDSASVHMTPAQKKELSRLLELYLAEHPTEEGRTLEELARARAGSSK
jgi:hypothetical protein